MKRVRVEQYLCIVYQDIDEDSSLFCRRKTLHWRPRILTTTWSRKIWWTGWSARNFRFNVSTLALEQCRAMMRQHVWPSQHLPQGVREWRATCCLAAAPHTPELFLQERFLQLPVPVGGRVLSAVWITDGAIAWLSENFSPSDLPYSSDRNYVVTCLQGLQSSCYLASGIYWGLCRFCIVPLIQWLKLVSSTQLLQYS